MDLRVGGHCIASIDACVEKGTVVPGFILDQCRHIIQEATDLVLNCDAFQPGKLTDTCKDLTTLGYSEVDALIAPRHSLLRCEQYAASLDAVMGTAQVTATLCV